MSKILLFCRRVALAGAARVRSWLPWRREAPGAAPAPVEALALPPVSIGALALQAAPEPAPAAVVESSPAPAKRPRTARRPRMAIRPPTAEDGTPGLWHLRGAILDRLDEYFACLRSLRRIDWDAFQYFGRVGFAVPPDLFVEERAIAPGVERRAFGGILCGGFRDRCDADEFQPSFIYFQKRRAPGHVEQTAGEVYRVTCMYDNRDRSRRWITDGIFPGIFHVALAPDGTIRLLRECYTTRSTFTVQHGRRRESLELAARGWHYPAWLLDCSEQHKADAREWARNVFAMAYNAHEASTSGIVIRARRDALVAAFGIELARARYFFADRGIDELAADGRRKRIFHAVVEHDRRLDAERSTTVRAHYRGLRHFKWNGYEIGIVLPANNSLLHFPAASVDVDDLTPQDRRRYLDARETGQLFARELAQ